MFVARREHQKMILKKDGFKMTLTYMHVHIKDTKFNEKMHKVKKN